MRMRVLAKCVGSQTKSDLERLSRPFSAGKTRTLLATCGLGALIAVQPAGLFWNISATAHELEEASRAAMSWSLRLRSDEARTEATAAHLRGSLDMFMPTVSLLGEQQLSSRISYAPNIPLYPSTLDTTLRREPNKQGIEISLPLFDGFKRYNNVMASRTLVEAGRFLSDDTRQSVVLDTAIAYLAIRRDRRVIACRQAQVASVGAILNATTARLAVSDATRTDVALGESRLEEAKSALQNATAELEASSLDYQRLTGAEPGRTAAPALPGNLPHDEQAIDDLIRSGNLRLSAARLQAHAADYDAAATRADFLPQANFVFTHGKQTDLNSSLNRVLDTSAKIQIKIPIYAPGAFPRSAEAQALAKQKLYDTLDAERDATVSARILFRRLKAVSRDIALQKRRAGALRQTIKGFEIERVAGLRTIFDALNTQAELAQADVAVATAEYEQGRLSFTLAAALGQLGPQTMAQAR